MVEMFHKGGPVLIILVLLSLLMLGIIIERLLAFRKTTVDQFWMLQQIGIRLYGGDIGEALHFAERIEGSLARVFEIGLKRYADERDAIVNAMRNAIARETLVMEKRMSIIGTCAVISPFVGLFGTVVGIMHAFESIAAKGGTGPTVVAAGVAEALTTTAAGLFVAIMAVVAFNYFRNRIRVTIDEMEIHCETLADMLTYVKAGKPFPADLREMLQLSSSSTVSAAGEVKEQTPAEA